jgi:hypothetical protein
MSSDEIRRPPRLPERLLRWLLPAGIVGESIVGDMREEYAEFLESDSKIPGPIWYWGRAFLIARRYALKRAPTVNQRPGRPQPRLAERMAHAAGSDPKVGNPADWPFGHGPQGDAIRILNFIRLVRDAAAL